MAISIKTSEDIEKNARCRPSGGRECWSIDRALRQTRASAPAELDRICNDFISLTSRRPFPPASAITAIRNPVCISVNEVVCHGIPDDGKLLKDGDIVNIDYCSSLKVDFPWRYLQNVYRRQTDDSRQAPVNRITQESLYLALGMVKPGINLRTIGAAIQKFVEAEGFSVVREYCAHGIGHPASMKKPQVLALRFAEDQRRTQTRHDLHHRADGPAPVKKRSAA
ncbi:M24 family metallopeptidase [Klebsiella pneumoniae]|nr:M24 family metallopeptidase [Klebsiella pneumoniae]